MRRTAGLGWMQGVRRRKRVFQGSMEPLTEIDSVEGYCNWMAAVGSGPLKGCSYELHSSSNDEANQTALFFGTFTAALNSDGGPVEPTGKQTVNDYVYALTMDKAG